MRKESKMARNQGFLPMRRGREADLSPWNPASTFSPDMFFSVSPWQMMRRIQEDMDRLFGQFASGPARPGGQLAPTGQQTSVLQWLPSTDISETDKEWTIQVELPGVKQEDVEVQVRDHYLVVRAELRDEEPAQTGQAQGGQAPGAQAPGAQAQGAQTQAGQTQGAQAQGAQAPQRQYHQRERRFGYFERVLLLPDNVDEERIACEFRNGVLTVHIPKTEQAQQQARRIPIGTGAQSERARGDSRTERREPRVPSEAGWVGARGGEAGTPEPSRQGG
jgi:HSP20 family protein